MLKPGISSGPQQKQQMVNASALLADLASRLPRRHDGDSLSLEDVPPFYLYDDAAFNFSSLLRCHALRRIAHTAKRERLAEVQLTQLLEAHVRAYTIRRPVSKREVPVDAPQALLLCCGVSIAR